MLFKVAKEAISSHLNGAEMLRALGCCLLKLLKQVLLNLLSLLRRLPGLPLLLISLPHNAVQRCFFDCVLLLQ